MNSIGFFTPIKYGPEKNWKEWALEKVDSYFYLGGKTAHVIQTDNGQDGVILSETDLSLLARRIKILSYCTIIPPAAMLMLNFALRSNLKVCVLDPKLELEKNVNIPEKTIEKIKGLMTKILERQEDDSIEWLSEAGNLVFKIKDNPELVFKYITEGSVEKRFKCMIKAKEVCLANHLGLLIIPQSKLVTVSGKTFIVEKFLDLNPIEWAQESLYITYANQMEEAIRQLSILIAKTGFSDVTWRNIPILNEEPGYEGPRRIGLIDLEGLGSSLDGFIGFFMNGSRGLINCLASERLIDIVIEEARNHGVLISNEQAQSAKKICRARLEFDEGLKKFYKEKKIEVGNELIEIDESLLDFSEYADEKKYKANSANNLKNTAIALIKEINCQIKESSPKNSVEGRRRILVNISSQELPWFTLQNQYLEKDTNEYTYSDSKVFVNNTCLGRAVNKLVELGAIYKLTQFSERGYYLQA